MIQIKTSWVSTACGSISGRASTTPSFFLAVFVSLVKGQTNRRTEVGSNSTNNFMVNVDPYFKFILADLCLGSCVTEARPSLCFFLTGTWGVGSGDRKHSEYGGSHLGAVFQNMLRYERNSISKRQ